MQFLTLGLLAAIATATPTPNLDINAGVTISNTSKEAGAVFALTNDPSSNEVIAFSRAADGTLTQVGRYATGGRGQGVDFDTQGGLTLNHDHTFLYAVNPADDLVSVFSTSGSKLTRVQTIYAGDQPLSISLSTNGYAYVLDGSVASTGIFGFKVDQKTGLLSPLTNKTVATSTPIGVPGTVIFSPDNKALVVTNKVGSTLDVFSVGANGLVGDGPATVSASSGIRPFAATFDSQGHLYVVESGLPAFENAGVSTYWLDDRATPALSPRTVSEKNGQTDGCWVIVTPNRKWAYTASFVSSALSSYNVADNGTVSLLKSVAFTSGPGSEPVDLALSSDGAYLYNLQRGAGGVVGFQIQSDGSLKQVGKVIGQSLLPGNAGVSGLAAF